MTTSLRLSSPAWKQERYKIGKDVPLTKTILGKGQGQMFKMVNCNAKIQHAPQIQHWEKPPRNYRYDYFDSIFQTEPCHQQQPTAPFHFSPFLHLYCTVFLCCCTVYRYLPFKFNCHHPWTCCRSGPVDARTMDDHPEQETLKFRVQRTVSTGDSSLPNVSSTSSSSTSTSSIGTNTHAMLISTSSWILFGLWGWYFPKYLVSMDDSIVSKTPPYQVTSAGDVILDFALNEDVADPVIISSAFLKFTSLYFPFIITVLYSLHSSRRSRVPFHLLEVLTVVASFSMAMGLSEGTTQLLKLWVQRRRPNFYHLCGFDTTTLKCTASNVLIQEAHFSFPSGHSSLSCCGMTFLVWYFLGKVKDSRRPLTTFLIAVLPWGFSIFVAGSRLVDKWHHPSDVVAGLGLGFAACTIAYHVWYPPVWSSAAGMPRPLLLDELLEPAALVGNNKPASFND